MAEKFSLKDHLFNTETVSLLAADYAAGIPGFDADRFTSDCLGGFGARELMQRLEWIADCAETQLAPDFHTMADQLEAAMPPPLNPNLKDDDFGHFSHAVPGILAVRHGLTDHRARAMDLLYAATKRFSMEFYIRPFLNHWPQETMAALATWARDDNYHVRRLVSEGTRPKLPWAKAISLDRTAPLPLLDALHADSTRFVTRSVSNHLNDIAKFDPDAVLNRLRRWHKAGRQTAKELDWMTRHALRSLIKAGHPGAMELLGFRPDPHITLSALTLTPEPVKIGGALSIAFTLSAPKREPLIVDYVLHLRRANGQTSPKVFKLKQITLTPETPVRLTKTHRFKGDATTFTLYPGPQAMEVQVNGKRLGRQSFTLTSA